MAVLLDTLATPPVRPRHPEKAHRPETPTLRKPPWIRVKAPGSPGYAETRRIVREHGLHTVCEEAGCPNIGECWEKRHATFMIMGDVCTRACAFCNVKTGLPGALNSAEPEHVADAVMKLGLAHVVVTSGDRDDLEDRRGAHALRAPRSRRSRPISCAKTAPLRSWSTRVPTCSTTISRPCRRNISQCGRARATSLRCGCSSRSRSAIRACSLSPASWSDWARNETKCSR